MSLYHEAADLLSTSSHEGGSLKSRVFGRKNTKSPPNQLYALVLETCKWSAVLKEVIEGAELLRHERKLTPTLALLLVHDLLLAKGGIALPQSHGLRCSIDRHKGRLNSEFTRARVRRGAASAEVLRAQVARATAGEEASHPRWVRVNALKSTVEEQLESTFRAYARAETIRDVVVVAKEEEEEVGEGRRHIFLDPHVPNLVAVTAGCDLSKTEAYASGKIILQDKASCFPAYLLDPRPEDGDVVDACAAPGNKTTHLAAIMRSHAPEFESGAGQQTVFAFEKDTRRARTLEKMVRIAGAKGMTRIGLGQDFLQVDPRADRFRNVGALLLDPSCSGSGIVGRDSSMPELHLPEEPQQGRRGGGGGSRAEPPPPPSRKRKRKPQEEVDDESSANGAVVRDDDGNETAVHSEKDLRERLEALASFQLALLLHAFRFPSAKKVTYSTCSVHSQENENVVMAALESDIAREMGWRILPREDQVSGMRRWPVRGLVEACKGDEAVAEGCIRTYKDDGHGVMGFFVAAFVRDLGSEAGAGDDGPYLRDGGGGAIVRDMMGMPVLKATGAPIALVGRDEAANDGSDGDDSRGQGEESEWDGFED